MNTAYSPQKHAAALVDTNAKLDYVLQSQAILRGEMARLLAMVGALLGESDNDLALDNLVEAAFKAKKGGYWIVAELLAFAELHHDAIGLELTKCIAATGKIGPRSLGIYLSRKIPAHSYVTGSGYEIRRGPTEAGAASWGISKV